MSKIKLNFNSGASVEKPLITAIIANNTKYVILDNEMNGTMGLPIILVCKLVDNRLVKITDANEWTMAKEYLKQIIAGNKLECISVDAVMNADDVYYTQLTLPIPSFEVLKKSYTGSVTEDKGQVNSVEPSIAPQETIVPIMGSDSPVNMNAEVPSEPVNVVPKTPVNVVTPEAQPATNVAPTPVEEPAAVNNMPSMPEVDVPTPSPIISPVGPITPSPVTPEVPVMDMPVNPEPVTSSLNVEAPAPTPVMPTFEMPTAPESPIIPSDNAMSNSNEAVVTEQVVSQPIQEKVTENIFASQKEAFLEACENMFDALVQKFEKELNNKGN